MLNRLFGSHPATPEIDAAGTAGEQAADRNLQIVDVREPDEWAGGHIAGAVLIPLGQFPMRMHELDPARPVIVVCRSGNRSGRATQFLIQQGFRDVKNMAGGMLAWVQARQPMER